MGRHDDIGLPSSDGGLSAGTQYEGVSHHSDKSINVGSQVDLDQVPVSQDSVGLAEEGGVVADHVVDGDAGGEGNSWLVRFVKTENLLVGYICCVEQIIQ